MSPYQSDKHSFPFNQPALQNALKIQLQKKFMAPIFVSFGRNAFSLELKPFVANELDPWRGLIYLLTGFDGIVSAEVTSMKKFAFIFWAVCTVSVSVWSQTNNQNEADAPPVQAAQNPTFSSTPGIWTVSGVGDGFRTHLQEIGTSVGAGWVTRDIGGKISHDILISRLYYGHMLGDRVGADKWYGGNWEFVQEVFGAWQYDPGNHYLTGTTSLIRYNFATGTPCVPFLDGGVGISGTDIGHPDLGTRYEFNGQIGPGINYFFRPNTALTLQYRYMHNSNGGLKSPNQGINENIAYVGLSWFF